MPPLNVDFGREALLDIEMILHESEARWGPMQAERYKTALDAAFRRIGAHPKIGPLQDDLPGIRALLCGQHRINYEIESDSVELIHILHQRIRLSDAD